MAVLNSNELEFRKDLAREVLSHGRTDMDDVNFVDFALLAGEAAISAALSIPFPEGLAPSPKEIDPKPGLNDKLPEADVAVVTWTVDENDGMADVLTPGFNRNRWYRYARSFDEKYAPQIRRGAPAASAKRLGSYFLTKIGNKKVLCFKSELHLNQDGIRNFNETGQTSLPVRMLFKQIIEETKCKHIITAGTCGGIQLDHDLGDVLVTKAAKFRCGQEFKNAPFNNKIFKSNWNVPTTHFAKAQELMKSFALHLKDPAFGPPTKRHQGGGWTLQQAWEPSIIHEGGTGKNKLPAMHPILTTDYFEFGNSQNAAQLWAEGCGVEMGDAVLGLVCDEDITHPPKWLVVRNLSDPQINGDITNAPSALNMQAHWAVWYYETYGYWTSVMSSLATWGVIAGL